MSLASRFLELTLQCSDDAVISRSPRFYVSKVLGTRLSVLPTQDLGTPVQLAPRKCPSSPTLWVLSPQGGAAIDQVDGPAHIGVQWQLPDRWVFMESLHALLEAGGRGGEGNATDGTRLDKGPLLGAQPSRACDPH